LIGSERSDECFFTGVTDFGILIVDLRSLTVGAVLTLYSSIFGLWVALGDLSRLERTSRLKSPDISSSNILLTRTERSSSSAITSGSNSGSVYAIGALFIKILSTLPANIPALKY
jgi:hypothetical protein